MRRKLLVFIALFALVFSLVGCTTSEPDTNKNSQQVSETDKGKESEKESVVAKKGTLEITLPADFVKTEEEGVVSYNKVGVGTNVNITKTANDGSLKLVTGEMMLSVLDPQLEEVYGTELTLTLIKQEKITIDGHAGFMYSFSYSYLGVEIIQTQYMLENDDVYEFVTFTNIVSEGYTEVLDECAKSITYK